MPKYELDNRDERRLRGATAYDRATSDAEHTAIASERLQMQRDRDETSRAFREAEAASKAEQRAAELGLRERIVTGRESQFAVANELTRTRQQLEADKLEFQKEKALREAEWAKQINPLKLQHEKVKLDRDASDFALDSVQQTKLNEDTQGFNSHMAELYARGASPDEVKAGFGVGLVTFPYADPKRLQQVGANLFRKPNGEPMTLDEISEASARLRAENPGARVTVTPRGATVSTPGVAPVPPALLEESKRIDKEYFDAAKAWRDYKAKNGPDSNPGNEDQIKALAQKRDEIGMKIHSLTAPAATADPRAALAQKALDDPNASEAHKAAARKILGLQ